MSLNLFSLLRAIIFFVLIVEQMPIWAGIPDSSSVAVIIDKNSDFPTLTLESKILTQIRTKYDYLPCINLTQEVLSNFLKKYPNEKEKLAQETGCKADYLVYLSKTEYKIFGEDGEEDSRVHHISLHFRLFEFKTGNVLRFDPKSAFFKSTQPICMDCRDKALDKVVGEVLDELDLGWQKFLPRYAFQMGVYGQQFSNFELFDKNDPFFIGLSLQAGGAFIWELVQFQGSLGLTRNDVPSSENNNRDVLQSVYAEGNLFFGKEFSWNDLDKIWYGLGAGYRISTYEFYNKYGSFGGIKKIAFNTLHQFPVSVQAQVRAPYFPVYIGPELRYLFSFQKPEPTKPFEELRGKDFSALEWGIKVVIVY